MGLYLLFGLVIGVVTAIVGQQAAGLVSLAGYVVVFIVLVMMTIQRSHDFNTSGWLSLLMFVPPVNLIFWFIPGSPGENRFGKRPPPNSVGVVVLACIMPFVFVVGILAAIAIPAYQDYTIRAQVSEGLNMAAEPKAAVQNAFRRTRSAPADRIDAGMSAAPEDTYGMYVASLDVSGGTILVTYGENANAMIAGGTLALQPYVFSDGSVVWRCAYGSVPSGGTAMDRHAPTSADMTNIEMKYLPSACRP
jgi:type IV pilus assembly protein PilA